MRSASRRHDVGAYSVRWQVSTAVLSLAIAAVLVAGLLHRLTGIGFALVASPILIVAVGTDEAVRVAIVTSLVSSSYSLWATRRACNLGQVIPLLPFAIATIWPAAVLAKAVSPPLSSLVAGVVVLLALGVALRPKDVPVTSRWGQAAIAGSLSGAMNAVAALGGPMAATYGIGRRWGASLVPNMQVFLLVTSLAVLLVRGWPATTSTWQLGLLTLAAAIGVGLGGRVAGRVSPRSAGILTAAIASVGACAAIVRGVLGLV